MPPAGPPAPLVRCDPGTPGLEGETEFCCPRGAPFHSLLWESDSVLGSPAGRGPETKAPGPPLASLQMFTYRCWLRLGGQGGPRSPEPCRRDPTLGSGSLGRGYCVPGSRGSGRPSRRLVLAGAQRR